MAINPYTAMVYKVDWLQLTENTKSDLTGEILGLEGSQFFGMLKELGYKDFEETAPRYFYNSGLTIGRYLNIYYDDPKKELLGYSPQNCMFQFTGQGSTDLALKLSKQYKTDDFEEIWWEFFKVIYSFDFKVTRLDVALDDFNGVLNFAQMERKLKRHEFRSSKKTYNIMRNAETSGKVKGATIYLGERKRHQDGYLIRFYDKFAEYKQKGAVLPAQVENVITGEGSHVWQRYEMEIHGKACETFINKILGGYTFGLLYKGLMRNAIEFLKASRTNKNRSYWKVCDWWEKFLDGAEKCKLTTPERDLDIGRLLRWLRVAVVPSLHLLDEIGKEKNFDIYKIIKDCSIKPYAKKQERLKREALDLPNEILEDYIDDFKEGRY